MIFDGDVYTGAQGVATSRHLQSFLQGIPNKRVDFLGQSRPDNTRMPLVSGCCVQDDWRINARITLNLGLRYEYYTPPVERQQLSRQL